MSIDRFVNWSSTAVGKNDFYTDWQARQMYKAHLLAFTSRVNSINGRVYRHVNGSQSWSVGSGFAGLETCRKGGQVWGWCLGEAGAAFEDRDW